MFLPITTALAIVSLYTWYVTMMVGIAFVVAIFMPDARKSGYRPGEDA